ncbi:MAG: DUF3139 domain-containing protein [Candidatus Paceibacteria bacterium]
MKKGKKMYIFLVLVLLFSLIGVFLFKIFYYDERQEFSISVDNYLKENNYHQQVSEKEIVRDSKTGEFFAKVVFQDEPDNTYEIYKNGANSFRVYGYKNGVEITDKSEGKYITEH